MISLIKPHLSFIKLSFTQQILAYVTIFLLKNSIPYYIYIQNFLQNINFYFNDNSMTNIT